MKKKKFTQNDIHCHQSRVAQGKNMDIPWISMISINSNDKDDEI